MIHRAPFGSMERFCGVLIEHFGGDFPTWLAPQQLRLLPISDRFEEATQTIHQRYRDAGIRVGVDSHSDKLGAKIRRAELDKVPYTAIIGEKEVESGTLSIRSRFTGNEGSQPIEDFLSRLQDEIRTRKLLIKENKAEG